jgi:hypothetical protein
MLGTLGKLIRLQKEKPQDRMYRPQLTNDMQRLETFNKPIYRINSLDRQNNDALKGNLLDTFKSATEIKPIPSATYSGTTSNIQDLKN